MTRQTRLISNPLKEDNCVRGYTLSLVLVIQSDNHLDGLLPKGDMPSSGRCFCCPVVTLLWCKPRQPKRLLSIHFVQSRNCDNLLSNLFIYLSAAHIWVALWWYIRWLEPTPCILWTKGRYEAIPWQALPCPAQTQSHPHERNYTAVWDWSVRVATIFAIGHCWHSSYPKRIAQCVLYQILGSSISAY